MTRHGRGGRELTRWARALGVRNDEEAIRELERYGTALVVAAVAAQELARVIADAPDQDAAEAAREATNDITELAVALGLVRRRFAAHERGGR